MLGFAFSRSLRNVGTIPTLKLGTPPNYTEFEADGTMVAYGNATTYVDETGQLLSQRLESPGSDIVQNLPEGTLTFKASARYPTDYVVYTLQLNHNWFNSNVDFHVHWFQTASEKFNWLIEYRWQINGREKTISWTAGPLSSPIFTYSAGTIVQVNSLSSMITPPGTAMLSELFQVRLYRDYTNVSTLFDGAETNGLDIDALFSDMHRQSNMLGSRQEYVK